MAAFGRVGAALALTLLFVPAAARAQAPGATSARSRLALELGAAHASVLDPVASPLRYSGAGAALALAYRRESAAGAFDLGVDLQAARMASVLSATPGGPRETSAFAAASATLLRRVAGARLTGPRPTGTVLLLGADLRVDVSVRDHRYSEPALDFGYGLALAALGPAARLRVARGRVGELRADAAAPLVGVALRPYADLAYVRAGIHPRAAAPPDLAGAGAGLAWALPLGRARVVLGWRLDWLRYRDADLYRAARQRIGAGVELPLGGGP